MTNDLAIWILPLMPLTAIIALWQRRPYQAVIARGIFGATAGLSYVVLGAPDVALTEFLIGTLLISLLYVITIRSSMAVRLGHVPGSAPTEVRAAAAAAFQSQHIRVDWTAVADSAQLTDALRAGDLEAGFDGNGLWVAPHAQTALKRLRGAELFGVEVREVAP